MNTDGAEKNKNNDFKVLKSKLIKDAGMYGNQFHCVEKLEELKASLEKNSLDDFPKEVNVERVSFRKCKSGIIDSLLAHIRNSFAHGRVTFYEECGKTYIVMEDLTKKDVVSARMIISKDTLLKWKTTIETGPEVAYAEIKKGDNNELGNGSCRAYKD